MFGDQKKLTDTCWKAVHRGKMDRRFTVFGIYEAKRRNICIFIL
jgi:hypothetical protein